MQTALKLLSKGADGFVGEVGMSIYSVVVDFSRLQPTSKDSKC